MNDDLQKLIKDIQNSTMPPAAKAEAIKKLQAEADKRRQGFKRKT